jgi:hypothetical protein
MFKKVLVLIFFLLVFSVFTFAPYLFASPTGLNNIPTADVVPEKILVLQSWANFGKNQLPTYYSGFKYGFLKGIEIGADGKVGSKKTGPVTFQFKYQLPLLAEDSNLVPLVGMENIATNKHKAGEVNPYVVLTSDFELFRGHLGYNFQNDNFGAFAGLDKTLELDGRDFILRADLKQTKDGHEVLGSFGFLHILPWNFILESWVTIPSENKQDETFTMKLNYVIEF